jgi:hypothetical protein
VLGERGVSKKLRVLSWRREKRRDLRRDIMKRRLHDDLIETSQNYPNTFFIDPFYTRIISVCKKSARLPIKGDLPTLVKGIGF